MNSSQTIQSRAERLSGTARQFSGVGLTCSPNKGTVYVAADERPLSPGPSDSPSVSGRAQFHFQRGLYLCSVGLFHSFVESLAGRRLLLGGVRPFSL